MTSHRLHESIWIVGGGFAGLSAAAALQRIAGVPHVTILEQSSDDDYFGNGNTESSPAAASQLGPNGLRALHRIGGDELVEKLLQDGEALTHVGLIVAPSSVQLIPDSSMEDTGKPQLLIQWKVLRRHLQDLVPRESIYTCAGRGVCGYKKVENYGSGPTADSKPTIFLVDREGNEVTPVEGGVKTPPPSLLIAADGTDSSLRPSLEPNPERDGSDLLQDNGRLNIKAVVEKRLDYETYGLLDVSGKAIPPGTALAHNSMSGSVACYAGPAGLGHTYWAISIADGDHNPDIRQTDTLEDTHSKLLAMLSSVPACKFAHDLISATPPSALYVQRSRQVKCPSQSFVSPDGCLVAVGDAAHAMSPAYGQGANVCFEDAVTLALAMQAAAANNNSSIDALQLYSQERVSRCEELLRKSALRAAQQARGEKTEDTFKWISRWTPPTFEG